MRSRAYSQQRNNLAIERKCGEGWSIHDLYGIDLGALAELIIDSLHPFELNVRAAARSSGGGSSFS